MSRSCFTVLRQAPLSKDTVVQAKWKPVPPDSNLQIKHVPQWPTIINFASMLPQQGEVGIKINYYVVDSSYKIIDDREKTSVL